MDRELARKQPATVLHARQGHILTTEAVYPCTDVVRRPFHERSRMMKEIHWQQRHGYLGHCGPLREEARGWAVQVVRLRPAPTRWARHWPRITLCVGSALVALAVAAGILWLLLPALPVIILALVAVAVASLLGGGAVTVIQNVTINR